MMLLKQALRIFLSPYFSGIDLYTPTLKKILPEASSQKQLYLKAIANETTTGKRLTDELVNAIVTRSKRNLAPEKVRAGLIAKCAEMLRG